MKVIVGLGNPGEQYQHNRHNVGFMVVEELARQLDIGNWVFEKKFKADLNKTKEVIYVKPQTYMNDSGFSVAAVCRFYKVKYEDLYVVHDDLDITLGSYKIQFGKGPQIHNGLLSVEEQLGTDQFWNVRVGVENREVRGNKGIPGVEYSLQNFSPEEKLKVDGVVKQVVQQLLDIR